jgi:hypothetical protein
MSAIPETQAVHRLFKLALLTKLEKILKLVANLGLKKKTLNNRDPAEDDNCEKKQGEVGSFPEYFVY